MGCSFWFEGDGLPKGSIIVPVCGLCLGSSNKLIPEMNYYGAYGQRVQGSGFRVWFMVLDSLGFRVNCLRT